MILHGKNFIPFIPSSKIQLRVDEIAGQITNEYSGKNPLCLVVMHGAFMFAADVLQHIPFPIETAFVKIKSYTGMQAGEITQFSGLPDVANRHVIILEDIIDTGNTLAFLIAEIKKVNPASVFTIALLQKQIERKISADVTGFNIPDVFVVGYGLDFYETGRNLPDIWQATE